MTSMTITAALALLVAAVLGAANITRDAPSTAAEPPAMQASASLKTCGSCGAVVIF